MFLHMDWKDTYTIPDKVTVNISRSPIESQWGSRKYPGQLDSTDTSDFLQDQGKFHWCLNRKKYNFNGILWAEGAIN